MPVVKVKHVVSFSSEDKNHPAENLLKEEQYRKWKCAENERNASVVFQLEKASVIQSIDIGNEGSAFVEVLVGRSASKDDFKVLLVASSFMTPADSKSGTNLNRVRMFGHEKLSKPACDEKWDMIKIVCTQPFAKNTRYGLSFIKFYSPSDGSEETKESASEGSQKLGRFALKDSSQDDTIGIGSFFVKQKSQSSSSPLQGAAAARASSSLAEKILQQQQRDDVSSSKKHASSMLSKLKAKKAEDNKSPTSSEKQLQDTKPTERKEKRKSDEESQPAKKRRESDKGERKSRSKSPSNSNKVSKKSSSEEQKPHSKRPTKVGAKKKQKPFERLMEGVVFALSGFQNPFRSQLRDMALDMGANYRPDWDSTCTHLVCAFANTPKFLQVQGKGGKIVSKEWIQDCHKKKKRLPWKQYRMGGSETSTEEEEDSDEEDNGQEVGDAPVAKNRNSSTPKQPRSSPNKTKSSSPAKTSSEKKSPAKANSQLSTASKADDDDLYGGDTDVEDGYDTEDEIRRVAEVGSNKSKSSSNDDVYDVETDVDSENDEDKMSIKPDTSQLEVPKLPDIFRGRRFFIYGEMDPAFQRQLVRYITALNGLVEDYMNEKISFVVTEAEWDKNFDEACSENPSIIFVKPQWVFACNDKKKCVSHHPYSITPKDEED